MRRAMVWVWASVALTALAGCQEEKTPSLETVAADAGGAAEKTAGGDAGAEATGGDAGAAASAVPAGVRFVQNPKWTDAPTPTDLVSWDEAAAKEDWGTAKAMIEQRLAGACEATPNDVLTLDTAKSRIGYVSYKNGELPVPGYFTRAEGFAVIGDDRPQVLVAIDVPSINSGNPVRDAKLLKLFFQVGEGDNGAMRYTADVAGWKRHDLPQQEGQSTETTLKGDLTLHGVSHAVEVPLKVTRTKDGWHASLARPVLLPLSPFALVDPLRSLMVSCNHKSMGDAVALQFDLALTAGCPKAAP